MNEVTSNIQFDFIADFAEIVKYQLKTMNFEIPEAASQEDISLLYFNYLKRKIPPRSRQVKLSKEIKWPPHLTDSFHKLISMSQKGEDLSARLSTNLLDLYYRDRLLNDWGIHHFHLGMETRKDGFIDRTGPLLFAWVSDEYIYAIDIKNHEAWTDKSLLEIINNNWPELIIPWISKNAIDIEFDASSEDLKKLRKLA